MIDYEEQAEAFLNDTGTTIDIEFLKYDLHLESDTEPRDIYRVTLECDGREYAFNFGQSIKASGAPSHYEILACLDVREAAGFEDFCADFGYDTDSRTAERIYKAIKEQPLNLERLYTAEQIEALNNIQ